MHKVAGVFQFSSKIKNSPVKPYPNLTFNGRIQQTNFINAHSSTSNSNGFLQFCRRFSTEGYHGTTILCVRKNGKVVMMADGQVTQGGCVVKPNVKKLRRIGQDKNVIVGFAGSTADAIALYERLEAKLDQYKGQLMRACVELAVQWRSDKVFTRTLHATMIVADRDNSFVVNGSGDVLEQSTIAAIGSGGNFALAAAKALIDVPEMDADTVAKKSMDIAADICIYTNKFFTVESLTKDKDQFSTSESQSQEQSTSSQNQKEEQTQTQPSTDNSQSETEKKQS